MQEIEDDKSKDQSAIKALFQLGDFLLQILKYGMYYDPERYTQEFNNEKSNIVAKLSKLHDEMSYRMAIRWGVTDYIISLSDKLCNFNDLFKRMSEDLDFQRAAIAWYLQNTHILFNKASSHPWKESKLLKLFQRFELFDTVIFENFKVFSFIKNENVSSENYLSLIPVMKSTKSQLKAIQLCRLYFQDDPVESEYVQHYYWINMIHWDLAKVNSNAYMVCSLSELAKMLIDMIKIKMSEPTFERTCSLLIQVMIAHYSHKYSLDSNSADYPKNILQLVCEIYANTTNPIKDVNCEQINLYNDQKRLEISQTCYLYKIFMGLKTRSQDTFDKLKELILKDEYFSMVRIDDLNMIRILVGATSMTQI
jgi:hypothetical protein